MAKTIQEQLAENIKAKFPEAEVKKVNQDNYVDIHLPSVHLKRGTHLFFNTSGGAIKLGFYCREEKFTQQVLAKNGNLEAYSQGVRPKGNPEWRKVDAACAAAFAFVESLTGFPSQGSSKTPRASASGNVGSALLQGIKAAYPKCIVNEEKSYASFTFKAAFLYELRIQKGTIRLLAANYPQKASVAKCFDLIARHDLFIHKIQNRYPVIVEPGKVSPDKLTVRIEIPYQGSDLENEGFITNLIATCEQFHQAVAPLINGFQAQPVGTLSEVMRDGTTPTKTSEAAPKKESPAATPSKEEAPSMFDLTEFDEEGRPIGMRDPSGPSQPENSEVDELSLEAILSELESQLEEEEEESSSEVELPEETPAEPAQFDESDRCLSDPRPFLTLIQLIRIYYLVLSRDSDTYPASLEETLQEFTKAAVVPRISNMMVRIAHEGDMSRFLLQGPMLEAEGIYDKDFDTHNDYTRSLGKLVSDLVQHCNTGLYLDTLELFMYFGDMLEEENSPTGSLTPQDRYFPLYLMLKASPEQNPENLEMVLDKGAKSRTSNNGCDVKALLLKASGNFGQLNTEEKLALMLYDFILWDENPGLDIKLGDIAAAKSIFTLVTQNAALGNQLLGGFNDNYSFEIFQFFNVEFNREGFHAFCLERWKELSSEWNALKLQLLIEGVKRDFHPTTYINNPVLKDYLKVYGLDEEEISTGKNSGDTESSGQLDLNEFLAELEADTSEEGSNDEEEEDANLDEVIKKFIEKQGSDKILEVLDEYYAQKGDIVVVEIDADDLINSLSTTDDFVDLVVISGIIKLTANTVWADLAKLIGESEVDWVKTLVQMENPDTIVLFYCGEKYVYAFSNMNANENVNGEDTSEEEAGKNKGLSDLTNFLAELEAVTGEEESIDDESDEEEDEEEGEEDDEEEEGGFPMISYRKPAEEMVEVVQQYLRRWQKSSQVYAWRMGIKAYVPEFVSALVSDKVCPIFTNKDIEAICSRIKSEKIIPILGYVPEEFYGYTKRVWWLVPFCIWKEDTASLVFIDKNGFYGMYSQDGEEQIDTIFNWDSVYELDFEYAYDGDPNINRLTLTQEDGNFLTFDEFVSPSEDDHGSYLAVIEAIWEARRETIEASKGETFWAEGAGGEGFVEFETPQDLLKAANWDNPHRPDPSMY